MHIIYDFCHFSKKVFTFRTYLIDFLKIFTSIALILQLFFVFGQNDNMINGVSLVSTKELLDSSQLTPVVSLNANWTAVIPYAFLANEHRPDLVYDMDGQWIGERIHGTRAAIYLCRQNGLKVMVKPQIWVGSGGFTGHIDMNSDADWEFFEMNYRKFILAFAQVAEEEGAEMFCIGTEMNKSAKKRPEFWRQLIKEVREIYSGQLTYAENWDCYDDVSFWNELDFIGVDAYFPLTIKSRPTKKDLSSGWERLELDLSQFCSDLNMQMIFTEYGYRSISNCAHKPWNYNMRGNYSEEAQVNALNALYKVMWDKEYFAGGFLWKWHPDHENAGGRENTAYTVQNKKAEMLVREVYGH
ncbi:MAG: glycoside hydrolase [Crocinitomicaceae bacterium]|nr:glycoside hydrolase [Crocinitomicaceae bacterium]